MTSARHPFTVIRPGDTSRPWLLVRYFNPHSGLSFRAFGLIDTGADDCILPAALAPVLGHDLEKGEAYPVHGVGGPAGGFLHTTRIEIPGFSTQETRIAFVEHLEIPLLGVRSFLSNFVLTVNYPEGWFSLTLP